MEVTIMNFAQLQPSMEALIEEAEFISFDCEFSGLKLRTFISDTHQARYEKIRSSVSSFALLSVGITFWTKNTLNELAANAFDFILCAPHDGDLGLDPSYSYQTSSVKFLLKNKFDINKAFSSGIPIISFAQYEEAKRRIDINAESASEKEKEFVDKVEERVKKWLQDLGGNELSIEEEYSFAERQIIKKFIPERVKQEKQKIIFVKLTEESRREFLLSRSLQERLDSYLQFSRFMDKIACSSKLLVGHNCMLDLAHLYSKIYGNMPMLYEDFKTKMNGLFRNLADTKCLAALLTSTDASSVDSSLSLGSLFDCLNASTDESNFHLKIPVGLKELNQHNAGYDSFLTGFCFIKLLEKARKSKNLESFCFNILADQLQIKNKVMLAGLGFISLDGPDPPVSRSNVLFISNLESSLKLKELKTLVPNARIDGWNDASAFAVFDNQDEAEKFLAESSKLPFSCIKFEEYLTLSEENSGSRKRVKYDFIID